MQCPQCFYHLYEDLPNDFLADLAAALLVLDDFLVEVTIVQEVHHDAEARGRVFEKCFFVTDNAPMPTQWKDRTIVTLSIVFSDICIHLFGCTYWKEARMRTSFKAFSFSLTLSFPILTYQERWHSR